MTLRQSARKLLRRVSTPIIYEKLVMRLQLGYWPNIMTPTTFNERIAHMKLFNPPFGASYLADKIAVRDYVAATIGSKHLTPLLHVGTDPATIPWDAMPEQFVIKFAHNSGHTIVIDRKSQTDKQSVQKRCQSGLADRLVGYFTNEPWYIDITPRYLIEERMIDQKHDIPLDYKFFVFNGRASYIQVDYARFSGHTRTFYSRDWKRQHFTLKYPQGPELPKPKQLAELLTLAEKLAGNYSFARVDLYLLNDTEIRFGEITFAPEAGLGRFTPPEMDLALGQIWAASVMRPRITQVDATPS